ncbi:MAG TPA: hypothetical protein VEJ18_02330 [Planctomycetota bacterium]|nr:hypothetical protein [Planctomycetota bacterium]
MRADERSALLARRPFRSVRLHISSGEHVDIRHPEMAIVARSFVAVGLRPRLGVADVVVQDGLIHIVKVTPAPAPRRRTG